MALALWLGLAALALRAVARGEPGSELPRPDYVIDLLDALNVTCSVRGVTRAAGPVPGVPAWEFHPRVPRLTLARDYAVSLLAGSQDALGFHFVARQRRGSGGTLVALVSPAATARDGRALLQLVSSARTDQLRLDYRAGPAMQPASLLFPGGSPFAHSHWARLALDLRPRHLALFVDCRRAVLLERGGPGDALNLQLPRDLQITFASLPGDPASKFLGSWQTAEISPRGFPRRPWHCENLADPFPVPQSLAEERYLDELPLAMERPALTDIHNYQHQPSEPEFAPGGAQPDPPALEERMRQVEERVAGLGAGLDTVKAQSSELLARVKSLEGCECRRPGCTWDGTHREEGAAWDKDGCTACVCLQGEVRCSARGDRPWCLGCSYGGQRYGNGEAFAGDACTSCRCWDGEVSCVQTACPALPCAQPVPGAPGQCCPRCQAGCEFEGQRYQAGNVFLATSNPCLNCSCLAGHVGCQEELCPPAPCAQPVRDPQRCCPICKGCSYAGKEYPNGAEFPHPTDPCKQCRCLSGNVPCLPRRCPPLLCAEPVLLPGRCCPQCPEPPAGCLYAGVSYLHTQRFYDPADTCRHCLCANGTVTCQRACDGCEYLGQGYLNGQEFPNPLDACGRCACLRGFVTCAKMPCDPPGCRHPARPPGQCCPLCQGCHFHGRACGDGETFPDPQEPCRLCTCLGGDVLCVTAPCPPLTCPHQLTEPGNCCPRCRGCVHEGREHADGARWFSSPCVSCLCADSIATCTRVRCLASCLSPVRVPGECCPLCAGCEFEGRSYSPGESFQPALDPCEVCTCELLGAGGPHVRCHRRECPSLVGCARSHVQPPGPRRCCPTCTQALSPCTAELAGTELRTPSDPCDTCRCQDLTWVCVRQACPQLRCPPAEQFTPSGACCPACNECEIEAGGRRVSDGESWTDTEDECISCTCNLGHVECHVVECQPAECQGGLQRVRMPGSCCYECQDADGACSAQGQRYQAGERWQVDACTTCTCVSGEVNCRSQRCPPAACSADEAPALAPGMCCPRCLPRPATCLAFGDPHYRTFDGRLLHFQGTCTYVLAQDCEGGDFSIHVSNEDRGRPGVSWTQEVTVRLGDLVVQLLQDSLVRVAGQAVTLPFLQEPQLSIQRQASGVQLSTHIGVKVLWSGRSQLEVSVPGSYRARTCGLCGDFNGHWQDDARLRSGRLARSVAAFGNSWKVQSNVATGGPCADGRDLDPCKEAGYRARKEANARCLVLTSGAFRPCHPLVSPQPFFAACAYDLCACGAGADADACLCEVLEAYATLCQRAGLALRWRSPTLCAVGCPQDRGYVFDDCGPPCPKTCFNKDAPLGDIESRCFKACVPGCQCPAGLVEHESRCIPPEACPRVVYSDP